jgi:hypothetical protein
MRAWLEHFPVTSILVTTAEELAREETATLSRVSSRCFSQLLSTSSSTLGHLDEQFLAVFDQHL